MWGERLRTMADRTDAQKTSRVQPMLPTFTGFSRSAGRLPRSLIALFALGAMSSAPAWATTVRGLSLQEKCMIAETIVRAEVISVATGWELEGQSAKTLVTFRVREGFKGSFQPGAELVVRQAGGTIGDFVHEIPGMSRYREGEEAFLFLESFRGFQVEIGVGIGKYGIETDRRGTKFVTHDPSVSLVYTKPDGSTSIEEAKPMVPEAIDKFGARLASYLSGARRPSGQRGPTKATPRLTDDPIPGKK